MTRGRKKLGIVRTLQVKLDQKTADDLAFLLADGEEIEEASLVRALIREARRLSAFRDKHGGIKVLDHDGEINLVSISSRPVDFGMMIHRGNDEPQSYRDHIEK